MLLRIGTRSSSLAVAQSEWVKKRLQLRYPELRVELVKIRTIGDRILNSPLSRIGGKGLFVKEIENALLEEKVDVAVHSAKDIPAELPDGLEIATFPKREDPRDAWVSNRYRSIERLPAGARVGTGSLRRSAQLKNKRPDLQVIPVRGNVDTRLRKLDSGDFDGILLAAAGLKRLGLSERISSVLLPEEFIPAIGQGALGLETRVGDSLCRNLLNFLNDKETEITVRAERAFLKELHGGCQVPLGAHGRLEGERLVLYGMVAEVDGSRLLRDHVQGSAVIPEDLGAELARKLIDSGAQEILARIYGSR